MKRCLSSFVFIFLAVIITLTGCTNGDPLALVGVRPETEPPQAPEIAPSPAPTTPTPLPTPKPAEPETEPTKPPPPPPKLAVKEAEHIAGFVDFSGVWRKSGFRPPPSTKCTGKVFAGIQICAQNRAMYRDFITLRAVSATAENHEEYGKVVTVLYDGEYHHFHGFHKSYGRDWDVMQNVQELVFNLTGQAYYSLKGGFIMLGLSGELTGQPLYDHWSKVGIGGEGKGFGIFRSEDMYSSEMKAKPAEIPEDGIYYFRFNYSTVVEGSKGKAPEGMSSSEDSGYFINGRPRYAFQKGLVNELDPLKANGAIVGQVESKSGGVTINRGIAHLYSEDSETTPIKITEIEDGHFFFNNVPVFSEGESGKTTSVHPIRYTVKIVHAEADVDKEVFSQPVIFFKSETVDNVLIPEKLSFKLDGLPEIGIKRGLVKDLSEVGKNHYAEIEQQADKWLDELSQGELDDADLEKLRRGIWAERVVREGAMAAEASLGMALKSLGALLAELYGDLADVESQRVASSRQFQKQRKQFQEGKLDVESAPRLPGVDPRMKGSYDRALQRLSRRADWADQAGFANKVTKLMNFALLDGLQVAGMDTEDAKKYSKWFVIAFRSFLDWVNTGSLKGLTVLKKTAISHVVESVRPIIFDNRGELDIPDELIGKIKFDQRLIEDFPSYTSLTKDVLELAVEEMIDWDSANFEVYQHDSMAAASVLNELIDEATNVERRHHYLIALTNTADLSADVFELLGKAHPWFKGAQKAMFVVKYMMNSAAVIDPVVFFFKTAPELTTEGVYLAYGKEALAFGLSAEVNPPTASEVALETEQLNKECCQPTTNHDEDSKGILYKLAELLKLNDTQEVVVLAAEDETAQGPGQAIKSAGEDYKEVINKLAELLRANEVGQAIELTAGDEPNTYVSVLAEFDETVSLLINQALAISPSSYEGFNMDYLGDAFIAQAEFRVLEADLAERMWHFYSKVLLAEYEGPSDPYYIAERNRVIAAGKSVAEGVDELSKTLESLAGAVSAATLLPAVTVNLSFPESSETAGNTIMASPEDFEIRAHVRNISSVPVSGLTALLTVVSPKDSVTMLNDQQLPVGDGTLAADDGARGTGQDEADVVWTIRYQGDLTDESVLLSVFILENGGEPASFVGFEGQQLLIVDPLQTDGDLDGMLDEYEVANGLDVTRDDSQEDVDNDGLKNMSEFRLGTDAQRADTDGDGLSDGEETTGGEDGFITDPLNKDSDGDGVPDSLDGAPVDPTTAEPVERPGEPIVSVDQIVITLTPEEPIAAVIVTNSGEGTLHWAASSENDALAVTVPAVFEVHPEGILIISVPQGFIFEAEESAETVITVIDAFGADKDLVNITVRVGPSP